MEDLPGLGHRCQVIGIEIDIEHLTAAFFTCSHLSKCGKKMPRYCDANGDKKISLAEWRSCMEPQRSEVTTTVRPAHSSAYIDTQIVSLETTKSPSLGEKSPMPSRLQGSNPLETYLKY